MRRKRNILRTKLAVFFLIAFLGAHLVSLCCDLGIIYRKAPKDHHHKSGPQVVQAHAGHGDHDHGHDHTAHGEGESTEDCCKDLSSSFFSSLAKTEHSYYKVSTTYTAIAVLFYQLFVADAWSSLQEKIPVPAHLPPPKIPDIRIFIQSFII